MQILERWAIAVVIDAHAEFFERTEIGGGQIEPFRQRSRRCVEVVAKSAGNRPLDVRAAEVPVHQHRGAHIGRFIDDCGKRGMLRDLARFVVIHIEHPGARGECLFQCRLVLVHGDVEHRDRIAASSFHPGHQVDVAFDTGDQLGVTGLRPAQLQQGTDAVCIAIE